MTPDVIESAAARIVAYLGCSGEEDHSPPPCWQCEARHTEIVRILKAAAYEAERVVGMDVVDAPQHVIRVLDTRQRAAEHARGRTPKIGDRVQRRRDPAGIVTAVGESWVSIDFDGYPGGSTREHIATHYDYLD